MGAVGARVGVDFADVYEDSQLARQGGVMGLRVRV